MHVPAPVADALHRSFLGNSLQAWLTAGLTAAVALLVALVLRRLLVSRLGVLAARTVNQFDDTAVAVLEETRTWILVMIAVLIALSPLQFPPRIAAVMAPALKLVILWQIALWAAAAIGFWVRLQLQHRTGTHDRTSVAMISAMGVGAKFVVWVLIVLTALKSVFDVEITAWITGLGVGGIAVALAVQNILGDLLAALAIVFDKPFDVGDFIVVDTVSGNVERIGLKTTHIRSVSGEQVIVGNGDLLKSRLRNFKRMQQRRVVLNLDVQYDTPPDKLARIPQIVRGIIEKQDTVRVDRSHVATFLDSAIRVETVYWVLDPDYTLFMDRQQAINLEILRRFNAVGISFAFPSRTVYHVGAGDEAPRPAE